MDTSGAENDTRGWILCAFSGLACIAGACVICIDIPVRLIPSKRNFRIEESNAFLASSLSLSFGVMLFSALYSMLPSSMRYLAKDGWDEHEAGFLMMGCFVGGFFGIQVVSRLLHRWIPSHVVDCDHSHDSHRHGEHGAHHDHHRHPMSRTSSRMVEIHSSINEATPLIPAEAPRNGHIHTELLDDHSSGPAAEAVTHFHGSQRRATTQLRRPSMTQVGSRVMSFFRDTKANCDEDGPCYGYSDPCGQECFRHLSSRSALARAATARAVTNGTSPAPADTEANNTTNTHDPRYGITRAHSHTHSINDTSHSHHTPAHASDSDSTCYPDSAASPADDPDLEAQHHHHVPTNAFLSIGLQTVLAIALHKFPEGFITYATNHASPTLGFNVFMALFVHNIAEGFAMALPLYLALGSRLKAVAWSALLGGLSQPLGAGVAVAWFKLARRSNVEIDATAYACLFAATAGIMVSVALQLFVESLSLNHNRNLSIFFAFLGMTMLGLSNALVTH